MRSAKRKLLSGIVLIAVVFAGLLGFRAYNARRFHLEKETRFIMDTYVTVFAIGPKEVTTPAIEAAMTRMQELNEKLNMLNPKSPVHKFNHEGVPISDPEIIGIVNTALQVSRESDGAFDITIEPVLELWGFYTDSKHVPPDEEIRAALKNVGYRYLTINDGKIEKQKPEVRIDLGGIAKGYVLKQAAKVLKEKGVGSALIDAGGDIFTFGKKGNAPWKVGIRNPRAEGLLGYLEVTDCAVMGSGDYERFFIKDGKRYHHIFNPKTGYPAQGVSGVTVVSPEPVPWGATLVVLGAEKGMEVVERKKGGMECIIVTDSGKVLYSSGLKDQLKQIPSAK